MGWIRNRVFKKMFTEQSADGVSAALNVYQKPFVTICVATEGSASFTIKFQMSIDKAQPDFSAAKSVSNKWDYVCVYDYEDGVLIAGDTGISFSGADDVRYFRLNTDLIEWFSVELSSYSAGKATVTIVSADGP